VISVIIPTYNRARLLVERAIPSLLEQSYADWECHIIGDGTDDGTVEVMQPICAKDKRISFTNLVHDRYPEGQAAWGLYGLTALNYGLDWARGDWISVLNDDDEYAPDNFETLLSCVDDDVDFIYGMSDTWKFGHPTGQLYGRFPPGDGNVTQGSYLYRRSLEYRYRKDCYSRGLNGDADMWIRMREGGVRFRFIPRVVHHYHRNWP
jgi:glycosyltransferase involved in cell wall biosynthesis